VRVPLLSLGISFGGGEVAPRGLGTGWDEGGEGMGVRGGERDGERGNKG
jgi:hypothetical protein